ncbi:MAG: DUF3368 domain-containing protein [Spiribacter salinus]|uniref:DUF3368 domain-containing protein n=1 Tax=Spiribacter salinus TaxID=1335746 RepID=A0A540VM07_9GAMM|nr:MAG: DUF3368 domain-containing protein [Spiribacter salinus]
MALIISDANILIDFECAALTPRLFQLDLDLAVPDLLYHDELSTHHGDLPALGLQLLELPPELISQAYEYRSRYSKPSIYDLFALVLSLDRQCPLLTGDKALRELARSKDVEVFGTIWLMEQLFDARLVTIDEMESAYGIMLDNQSRLPEREIGRQLRRLKARF